jgi:hypothetical protein
MGRRSRKRTRPGDREQCRVPVAAAAAVATRTRRTDAPRSRTARRIGQRPKPVWDPWPVSEVATGAGLLLAAIGALRGAADGGGLIGVGLLLATVGVIELCVREHFSGFKSHTLLLAFLPVVALHTALRLWVSDRYVGPVALMIDAGVFAALGFVLLDRFRRAQR